MFSKVLFLVSLIIFIINLFPCAAFGAIRIISEPGIDTATTTDVQRTVYLYHQMLKDDLKVILDRDITLFLCPTKENYAVVLQSNFGNSSKEAERLAAATGGLSKGNTIALNGSTVSLPESRTFVTAHELFHQVQNQLAGDKKAEASYWIREGTADLIGALICEKSGFQSMETWKLKRINIIHNATDQVSPSDLLSTNFSQWMMLVENKLHPYEMSDLMVFYLMKHGKGNNYGNIATYFSLIGKSLSHEMAFEQAFGINEKQFLSDFQVWLSNNKLQSAQIEIIPVGNILPTTIADIEQTISLTRQFYKDKLNQDLESSMRIILISNKESYAAAMVKELGITPSQAELKANAGHGWQSSGNTIVLDVGSKALWQKRTSHMISIIYLLTSHFTIDALPQQTSATGLYWLSSGSNAVINAQIMDSGGISSIKKQQQQWLDSLQKHSALPDLTDLQTLQGWTGAQNQYDANIPKNIAAIATSYLVEQYGFKSLSEWMKLTKTMGDGEQAFNKVYGMSSIQFSAKFKAYLSIAVNN